MLWSTFLSRLDERRHHPLPGREAQYRFAHAGRYPPDIPVPPEARDAGVLMLMYPHDGEVYTVFIRRTSGVEADKHRGQIGFPGGKREESDADLASSAVREAEEEVGVDRQAVHLVRDLTPLYIPVSNFLVHPFLALTVERPDFRPQPDEVAEILEVPLRDLIGPDKVRHADIRLHGGPTLMNVPGFHIHGYVLWGATAMILNEFREWWSGS